MGILPLCLAFVTPRLQSSLGLPGTERHGSVHGLSPAEATKMARDGAVDTQGDTEETGFTQPKKRRQKLLLPAATEQEDAEKTASGYPLRHTAKEAKQTSWY